MHFLERERIASVFCFMPKRYVIEFDPKWIWIALAVLGFVLVGIALWAAQ